MLLATGLVALALVACLLVPTAWGLAIAIAATGVAGAVWGLARQAYLSEAVPIEMRARALSTLGGVQRIGSFIGPFLGAFAMRFLGTDGAYWVHLVAAVLACGVLVSLPDIESVRRTRGSRPVAAQSTWAVIRDHMPVLRTLGVGALLVGAVRASRQVVIPAVGAAHRARSAGHQHHLRAVRCGRHAAVLSGRFGDGPPWPQVGRRTVDVRPRAGAPAAAVDPHDRHADRGRTADGRRERAGRRGDHDARGRCVSTDRPSPVPRGVPGCSPTPGTVLGRCCWRGRPPCSDWRRRS